MASCADALMQRARMRKIRKCCFIKLLMICGLLFNKDMKKKFTTENTDEHGVKIRENFRGLRAIRGK